MPFTATCSRVILGGMTLAAPGATGFVALAQRAVIEHVRSCFSTVCCPDYRTATGADWPLWPPAFKVGSAGFLSVLRTVGAVQSPQIGVVGNEIGVCRTTHLPFRGPGTALSGLLPSPHQSHQDQERGKLHEGPGDGAANRPSHRRRRRLDLHGASHALDPDG